MKRRKVLLMVNSSVLAVAAACVWFGIARTPQKTIDESVETICRPLWNRQNRTIEIELTAEQIATAEANRPWTAMEAEDVELWEQVGKFAENN